MNYAQFVTIICHFPVTFLTHPISHVDCRGQCQRYSLYMHETVGLINTRIKNLTLNFEDNPQ